MAFELPKLPYAYNALEPHIDARTMEIHHSKHHQAYTTNLNNAIAGTDMEHATIEEILSNCMDKPAVRNNGGGFWNHNLFWEIMSPTGGGNPSGALATALDEAFGSFEGFKDTFTKAAATRFGSGWAWLVKKADGSLDLVSTSNAGTPLTTDAKPLLTCDVWEHAYYVDYRNARPKYVESFWNLVNWDFAAANFA
jgi:Fe-Mn family superoxide dismutase